MSFFLYEIYSNIGLARLKEIQHNSTRFYLSRTYTVPLNEIL